ncbi:unnamed protein product [Boreogadus saida]
MSVHKGHNLEPVEEPRHWLKYGGLGLARSQTLCFCSEFYLCLLPRDASSPQQIKWFVEMTQTDFYFTKQKGILTV